MTPAEPPYLDSHCHVQARQFANDRDAVIDRAVAAGVGTLICASDDEHSSREAIALAHARTEVLATVGIHPHHATTADRATLDRMRELALDDRVIAYGEIGLDYFRDLSPRDVQRAAFAAQLELAADADLPVVIHSRDAAEDTYSILRDWRQVTSGSYLVPGVIHCFGYDADWAVRFLALDFTISIPGTVTYPNATAIQEVARTVPEARLLVETDCPYLTPQPWRGKRNEPAYVVETVKAVAALRGVDPVELGRRTAASARGVFRIETTVGDAGGPQGAP